MKKKKKKLGKIFQAGMRLAVVFIFVATSSFSSIVLAETTTGTIADAQSAAAPQSVDPNTTPDVSAIVDQAVSDAQNNANADGQQQIIADAIAAARAEAEAKLQAETAAQTSSSENQNQPPADSNLNSQTPIANTDAAAAATTVSENDPSATNTDTGAVSDNTSQTDVNNNADVTNNNNAVTINHSYLQADTGHNTTSYNTGSGIITTQKAKGNGELMNVINKNSVGLGGSSGIAVPVNAVNGNTGAASNNQSETNINNQLTVKNINDSNTINSLDADVYSGGNASTNNTSHGIILTGDANMGLNFITMANTNLVGSNNFYANTQNVFDNYTGNINLMSEIFGYSPLSSLLISAANSSTGALSNNSAIVNVNNETTIINSNTGKISNRINANVVSGKNISDYNSGTGSVTTGNVNSSVNVLNFLNSNVVASRWLLKGLNVFGGWTGDIVLPQMPQPNLSVGAGVPVAGSVNNQTGALSNNSADVNVNNDVAITNSNEGRISNNISLVTDTGSNLTSYNTGTGSVKFGDALSDANQLNVANQNITGDSWWMVVVNKFGSWSGTTIGSPEGMAVSGSPETVILTPLSAGIEVVNNATGPNSNNAAGVNINNGVAITNTNDGDIQNDITVNAISGQNEAQYNTGHGYIETGNVRNAVNVINFNNSNITVGNWVVVVVNVFGDWNGNIVFSTPGVAQTPGLPGLGLPIANSANIGTGAVSDNNASSATDASTNVINNNDATTNNNTSASSLTGQNNANYNTGSGIIATGQADTTSQLGNEINTNSVGLGGTACVNANNAANAATGALSANNADSTVNCDDTAVNNNTSNTDNNFSANNTTGLNSSNYNTGDGTIDTSWATTYLGVYNQLNDNDINMSDLQNNFETGIGNSTGGGGSPNGGGGGGGGPAPAPIVTPVPTSDFNSGGIAKSSSNNKKRLRGDLNGDGKVNDYDLSILLGNWGKKIKNKIADIDGNGKVDDRDFSVIMADWTKNLAIKAPKIG